jgi:hypothetical protein
MGCVRFWLVIFIYGPSMTFAALAIVSLIGIFTNIHRNLVVGIFAFAAFLLWFFLSRWVARIIIANLHL